MILPLKIITERSQSLNKVIIAVLILIISINTAFSQINLVANPSFEIIKQCPSGSGQIDSIVDWDTLKSGGGSTPDLFHTCCTQPFICGVPSHPGNGGGFQYPHSGNSYVGILTALSGTSNVNYREYIQGRLIHKLKAGDTYCIKFYANFSNFQKAYIKTLGAYLDNGSISAPGPHGLAIVNPQVYSQQLLNDTLNWMTIEGYFMATGIENYITLGNFFSDSNSGITFSGPPPPSWASYYNIDDVSVIDISTSAYAGKDTSIALGDSVFIGRPPEIGLNEDCIWFVHGIPTDTIAGMWVKPDTTTNYILQQTICGIITYDTIVVHIIGDGILLITNYEYLNILPNPTTGDIWMQFDKRLNDKKAEISIYDLVGGLVFRKNVTIENTNKIVLNLSNGTYFISVKSEDIIIKNGKITISK
jgi:hypothetical protein